MANIVGASGSNTSELNDTERRSNRPKQSPANTNQTAGTQVSFEIEPEASCLTDKLMQDERSSSDELYIESDKEAGSKSCGVDDSPNNVSFPADLERCDENENFFSAENCRSDQESDDKDDHVLNNNKEKELGRLRRHSKHSQTSISSSSVSMDEIQESKRDYSKAVNKARRCSKHSQTSFSSSSSSFCEEENEEKENTVKLKTASLSCRCSFRNTTNLPPRRSKANRRRWIRRYRRRRPSVFLNLSAPRNRSHDEAKLFIVGILQICAGAIVTPLGVAKFYIERVAGKKDAAMSGIWCGIIFILTGAQAMITSRYPSRTKAFVGLGLSVASSVASIAVEVQEILSASEMSECNRSSMKSKLLCLEAIFALHIALCGIVFTEIVISGIHTFYAFQVTKQRRHGKEIVSQHVSPACMQITEDVVGV